MTDRELMVMALDAMKRAVSDCLPYISYCETAITALRERLAQPEPYDQTALELCDKCGWKAQIPGECCLMCAYKKQPDPEPVAYLQGTSLYWPDDAAIDDSDCQPLYTHPPRREWQGLTDEEKETAAELSEMNFDDACRFIEAALKEKNT